MSAGDLTRRGRAPRGRSTPNQEGVVLSTMLANTSRGWVAGAIPTLAAGAAQAAQTLGPVTDPIGVVRIPKGAPIQIGGMWVISGPDTALGLDEQRGVQIAFRELGGKLLGHPLRLDTEDDQCNPPGGPAAA